MQVVDAHCHVGLNWYQPVESLLDEMQRCGVAQAVLVQMLGQFHNDYLFECLERFPGRFACVVAVDVAMGRAAGDAIADLANRGATGIRLRPQARSPGGDPLEIWRAAAGHGLVVSCVGSAEDFAAAEFRDVLSAVPDLTVVLEHLGGSSTPDAAADTMKRTRRVFELAELPNVCLKVPGLGELVPRRTPLPRAASPFVQCPDQLALALERFGARRLMWGSDYPPVAAREGYGNALNWVRDALQSLAAESIEHVFGETARRIFRLPPSA